MALTGDALVALGVYLVSRVYHANTFASATIEIAEDQRVISRSYGRQPRALHWARWILPPGAETISLTSSSVTFGSRPSV